MKKMRTQANSIKSGLRNIAAATARKYAPQIYGMPPATDGSGAKGSSPNFKALSTLSKISGK
jgi:hypothetical protein